MSRPFLRRLFWRAAFALTAWAARSWFDEIGRHHHAA